MLVATLCVALTAGGCATFAVGNVPDAPVAVAAPESLWRAIGSPGTANLDEGRRETGNASDGITMGVMPPTAAAPGDAVYSLTRTRRTP